MANDLLPIGVSEASAHSRSAGTFRFAFLNLRDHPRGQVMLEALVKAGFVPHLVIDEESERAEAGRNNQLRELIRVPKFVPRTATSAFCGERGIAYMRVINHNGSDVASVLSERRYGIGVLGDTRILHAHIIRSVQRGIINVHPGVLPLVRGSHPYVWAIIHGLAQGATAHFIDDKVDHGPILLARHLAQTEGMTYPDIIYHLNSLCAEIIVEVMRQLVDGKATLTPQPDDGRMTFRAASADIKRVAALMLSRSQLRPTATISDDELAG
ncbi:hypothetical protein JJB98_29030 [Bradyrhizobium diazoefficiens]|nr:formyltransferase family protein [Bradyrhizobium diazoefficiens]QQO23673.1 hypothetical protein JJB98_29030 [Bradyrhizobium diazoefficiens]